jgi:hypothetical protein
VGDRDAVLTLGVVVIATFAIAATVAAYVAAFAFPTIDRASRNAIRMALRRPGLRASPAT